MKHDKQKWLALISEQQQGDLSIAAFCREKNIKVQYFYYHRSQHLKTTKPSAFVQAKPPTIKTYDDKPTRLTLQCGNGQLYLSTGVSAVCVLVNSSRTLSFENVHS